MGDERKPTSRFWACFSAFCGFVSLIGWLGVTPERVGQLANDVLHPILGVAAFVCGALCGWFLRDWKKDRDAEIAARIQRENAEHAEKMRRDRDVYDASQAAQVKLEEDKRAMEAMANEFATFPILAKVVICRVYDEGSCVFDDDILKHRDEETACIQKCTRYETLPDNKVRLRLSDRVNKMLDEHEELLADIRLYIKRRRAAKDVDATRNDPSLMLPFMDASELQTLQTIIEHDGHFDPYSEEFDEDSFKTLVEFGVLLEYFDDPLGLPTYDLDEAVLSYFKQDENKDLISSVTGGGEALKE